MLKRFRSDGFNLLNKTSQEGLTKNLIWFIVKVLNEVLIKHLINGGSRYANYKSNKTYKL
jgi:hypothetical protein